MSERSTWDIAAVVLYIVGFAAAVVELFFRPFLFGPIAGICVLAGVIMSTQNRRLGSVAIGVVTICWLIGASYAIWNSNPLY